jgi:hypothetical protein
LLLAEVAGQESVTQEIVKAVAAVELVGTENFQGKVYHLQLTIQ